MLLSTTNLVHYLITRGLIPQAVMFDGSIRIVDFGRRNHNFKVFLGDAPGLFLKQLPGSVESPVGGPSRELACHRLACSRPEYTPLLYLMPRFRDHDPVHRVLTVELVHPGEDLRERIDRLGPIPESLAISLGQALGRLHALEPVLAVRPADLSTFPRSRPWLLDALRDIESMSQEMNPAQREYLSAIPRSPELTYGLDGLRNAWRPTTLIHGDLKLDNIMLLAIDAERTEPRFIDWELADIGDPAWDAAALLLTCLETDLTRSQGGAPPDDYRAIEPSRAAFVACWRAYARTLGLSPDREAAYRIRCIHYLGAKLLLFAVEVLGTWPEAIPTANLVTRLARSIMIDPERVADDLLGSG